MQTLTTTQTSIGGLAGIPARSRIEAIELESGEWLASSSEFPALIGAGPTVEDAMCEMFDLIEVAQRSKRQPRNQ